jgi:uncharacterized protein (DUF305 family)
MKTKKTWLALLASLAVVALAAVALGCGDDDSSTAGSQGSTTHRSVSGNQTDAAFITDMNAHHQGAIDMAKLAEEKAEHSEIRSLAGDIISAQEAEISVMKRIADDVEHMGGHGSGHMGMSDAEMGMDMDMSELENAKPFDKAFIDAMVPHHKGAIAMAKDELAKGSQPALRKMAQGIITAQTKEIAHMRAWRKAWYGLAGRSDGAMSHDSDEHMGDDGHMEMG